MTSQKQYSLKLMCSVALMLTTTISSFLQAQDNDDFKTIFGAKEKKGYGAMGIAYSNINNINAMVYTGRGGLIIGNNLALGMGVGGSGFITTDAYDINLLKQANFNGGYGGVFLELLVGQNWPVHISMPVFAGLGRGYYASLDNEGTEFKKQYYNEDFSDFFVAEAGVELEFNISGYSRLAAFASYRVTNDIDIRQTNSEDIKLIPPQALTGFSAGVIIKFGNF